MSNVAIIDDAHIFGVLVKRLFKQAKSALADYELTPDIQILTTGAQLLVWLDQQVAGSVRLLILDYALAEGTILQLLDRIRTQTYQHPALHSDALLIGWSRHLEAGQAFQQTHIVDGFISKSRPAAEFIDDLLDVIRQRRAGRRWVALM